MYKKLLTIEDLVKFCETQSFHRFNASETGYQLSVQVPATATYSKKENTDGTLLFCKVKLFHTGRNRNGSNVTENAAKNALSTIAYKPLLANFCEIDGVRDFTSHDMVIDEDGNVEYIERQIGAFTADAPYMEYDEEEDKTFVYAYAAVPREYTDAADIIERKDGTKVSVELIINSMSYDAKERVLDLEDIIVQGATCLGKNPETGEDVGEGMKGARLDIMDFSISNNSPEKELLEEIKKLNENLSRFNIESFKEGGNEAVNKFEELLQQYNKTVEDITFEYEGLSDEELEAAFAEAFNENTDEDVTDSASESDEQGDENDEETGADEEENAEETAEEETATEVCSVKPEKYSISMSDGTVKEFELTLDDITYAIFEMVNATYGEADNTYYYVSVYENNYVIMHDYWNGKAYKQTYSREGDNFSLIGDRVEVFANWLTAEEETTLSEMRSNYAAMEAQLKDFQAKEEKAQKDALFTSEDYSSIADKKEFTELAENHADFSVEELKAKLDDIILSYAKSGSLNFASTEETKKPGMIRLPINSNSKKNNRYGTIFSK